MLYINITILGGEHEIMRCPYCNNELKTGWLKSQSEIYWSEKKSKIIVGQWDDLLIAQSLSFVDNVPTDYCETCKKLFVNIKNEDKIV